MSVGDKHTEKFLNLFNIRAESYFKPADKSLELRIKFMPIYSKMIARSTELFLVVLEEYLPRCALNTTPIFLKNQINLTADQPDKVVSLSNHPHTIINIQNAIIKS